MSDTNAADPQVNKIILVALSDLRHPDWNPRPFLDEAEMQSLVAFITTGGHTPPIFIFKGSNQPLWNVISGKRRCEAARRAGKTHIEAIMLDISLEEAKFLAIAANRDNKPFWLGEFIAVENIKKESGLRQVKIIAKLGWPKKRVSYAINLTQLLNPASRELIYQAAQEKVPARNFLADKDNPEPPPKKPWQFTEDVAIRLIPLLDETALEASQALAEKAVQIILNRQLTATQTDDLVAQALAGKDLAQFEPAAREKKVRKSAKQQNPSESVRSSELEVNGLKAAGEKTGEETLSATEVATTRAGGQPPVGQTSAEVPLTSANDSRNGNIEAPAPDVLAGISVISRTDSLTESVQPMDSNPSGRSPQALGSRLVASTQAIKAKIKKGEKPSWWEAILLADHTLALGWLAKHAFKLVRPLLKFAGRLFLDALKSVARLFGRTFYQAAKGVVIIALLVGAAWLGWDVYKYGIFHPIRVIESTFQKERSKPQALIAPVPTPHPTLAPVVSIAVSLTPKPQAQTVNIPTSPKQELGVSQQVQTPTVQKNDAVGQAVGSIGKQVGTDVAGDVAKKLFGL